MATCEISPIGRSVRIYADIFFLLSFDIGRTFIPRPIGKRPDENHLHFNLVFYASKGGVLPKKLGGGMRQVGKQTPRLLRALSENSPIGR